MNRNQQQAMQQGQQFARETWQRQVDDANAGRYAAPNLGGEIHDKGSFVKDAAFGFVVVAMFLAIVALVVPPRVSEPGLPLGGGADAGAVPATVTQASPIRASASRSSVVLGRASRGHAVAIACRASPTWLRLDSPWRGSYIRADSVALSASVADC